MRSLVMSSKRDWRAAGVTLRKNMVRLRRAAVAVPWIELISRLRIKSVLLSMQ